MIKSKEDISFEDNNDLIPFYSDIKSDLIVAKFSVLALSDIVLFDGSNKKPFEIFERKLDPSLKSDIAIEIGEESIIINYKSEDFQFNELPNSKTLNYPYIYMGLQKALYKLIVDEGEDNETLDIDDMDVPSNGLNLKLYTLLKSKFIEEVNTNNMDEVINIISDKILEKYVLSIKGIVANGN